jgi:outer membrane protein assembly factor BamA
MACSQWYGRPAFWCGIALALTAGTRAVGVSPVAAQEPAVCAEGVIEDVVIDNHSVFDLEDRPEGQRFSWAYRLANRLHVRTRAGVIARELLFAPGDCYDVDQLRDSERLLRELRFIARAEIYGVYQPDGRVRVVVDTQDEWSTRMDARLGSNGSVELRGLRLLEDNVAGTGQHLSIFYDKQDEERVYGAAGGAHRAGS